MGFDIEKEKEYVLGMMDMYPNDSEVRTMLRMKGLSIEQVEVVLDSIRKEGYVTRVRQAKKMIWLSIIIAVIAGATYLLMLPAIYNKEDHVIGRVYARMLTEPFFYIALVALLQFAYGAYRFISYSSKLKKIS